MAFYQCELCFKIQEKPLRVPPRRHSSHPDHSTRALEVINPVMIGLRPVSRSISVTVIDRISIKINYNYEEVVRVSTILLYAL